MAQIAKKTKCYPSDLTDEEWGRLAPLMPKPGRRGRPREVAFREVIKTPCATSFGRAVAERPERTIKSYAEPAGLFSP